jgi:glycosyltransferase involved in cell wall biosynthesis
LGSRIRSQEELIHYSLSILLLHTGIVRKVDPKLLPNYKRAGENSSTIESISKGGNTLSTKQKNQLFRTLEVPQTRKNKKTFDTSIRIDKVTTVEGSDKPLRIAQIAPPWLSVPPQNYGGTEAVISNLTEELVRQGHEVTLFASGDSQTNAELISYVDKGLIDAGFAWDNHSEADYHLINSFREIANNPEKYDVVHIHVSSTSDLHTLKLASQISVPHICTLHSRFPLDKREDFTGLADNYYLSFAQKTPMIAISERAKEDALESGFPVNIVEVVPHGLPDNHFLKKTVTERSHLAWVGKICRNKGTKYAIEAAVKAKRKILIAGVIDEYVPDSIDYFNEEVKPLLDKHPEYAEFIGSVNTAQRMKLLEGAYCFLNPIEWEEPFGLVMIEAMACGAPVISYKRGAANQLIKPGINGAFAASVDEMAELVESVGKNIDREKMVADTWDNYSVTRMAKRYVEEYEKVINTATANLRKSFDAIVVA